MNENELKKLNRRQLLELLFQQTEYSDSLKEQLYQTKKKLESRTLLEQEAGSIAEASLKISGVFEAAQAAADMYLENVRRFEEDKSSRIDAIEAEYRMKAEQMLEKTRKHCEELEAQSRLKAELIIAEAEEQYKCRERESRQFMRAVGNLCKQLDMQIKLSDAENEDEKDR